MRTASSDVIAACRANTRVVDAYLVSRDIRLKFASEYIDSDDADLENATAVDAYPTGNPGLLRITMVANTIKVKLFYWTGITPALTVTTTAKTGSKPGLYDNRVFYQKTDDNLYYRDITIVGTTLSLGTETLLASFSTYPVTIAPVYYDTAYIMYFLDDGITDPATIGMVVIGSPIDTWEGRLYGLRDNTHKFDAVRLGNYDYIFADDFGQTRILYMRKKYATGAVWGSFQPVAHMDLIDDLTHLSISSASVIDSKIFLSCIMSRKSGQKMHVYLMGPPPFTMGRDLYVGTIGTEIFNNGYFNCPPLGLNIHLSANKVVALGVGILYSADATYLVGYDNPSKKVTLSDVASISVSDAENSSVRVSANIPSSTTGLVPSGETEFYVRFDGTKEIKLCEFGIDLIGTAEASQGSDTSLVGRGVATKRLSQWTSDYSYDIYSQIKQSVNPALLSDLIVAGGRWENASGKLEMTLLNQDGIMYSVASPGRNTVARARFEYSSDSQFDPQYGILLNYYRESSQAFYAREGRKASMEGLLYNCLAFVWDAATSKFHTYHVRNSIWTQIREDSGSITAGVSHWIEASFNEGVIRLRTRTDASTNWTDIYTATLTAPSYSPWGRDQLGRAGIYVKNVTPNSSTPGLSSSNTVIPVADNSVFPTTDVVIVDSEQISYDGKSPNTPFLAEIASGTTLGDASHSNANWVMGVLMQRAVGASEGEQKICDVNANRFVCKSITVIGSVAASKVKFRVKKVGSPGTLYCHLVSDDYDNAIDPVGGAVLASVGVAAASIGTSFDWVEFDIPDTNIGNDNYFFVLTTSSNGYSGATVNASNYYVLGTDTVVGYEKSIVRIWGSPWVTSLGYAVPYILIGTGNAGDGYEIYLDGAGTPAARDIYNGMALVVESENGIGGVFEVTDYDYQAPAQWIPNRGYLSPDKWQDHVGDAAHGAWEDPDMRRIFVRTNPSGVVAEGMKVKVYASLLVDTRGYDGTAATTHSDTTVSLYRDLSAQSDRFDYFTANPDYTFEDMAKELARKAGVLDITAEKHYSGTIAFANSGWNIDGDVPITERYTKNMIVDLSSVNYPIDCGLAFHMAENAGHYTGGKIVLVTGSYVYLYENVESPTLVERYDAYVVLDDVRISVFDNFISVWAGSRLLCSFVNNTAPSDHYAGVVCHNTDNIIVDWSMLDRRINDFLMGEGRNGIQLLSELINTKHIYFADGQSGDLRLFRSKTDIGGSDYTLEAVRDSTQMDAEIFSRLRIEGIDMYEVMDEDLMKNIGNIYTLAEAREANSLEDMIIEADFLMDDMAPRQNSLVFTGAADPRIQPLDIIPVNGVEAIVSSVSYSINTDDNSVIFDMKVEGRHV